MLRSLDSGGVVSERNLQFLADGLEFKRKTGDLFNTAYMLNAYCMTVAYHYGQPQQAKALMEEGCALFEQLGDPLSKEMALHIADPILGINGRYDEQLTLREKKLAYAQERGDLQVTGIYLSEIGETLAHLGDYDGAEVRFREALALLKKRTDYQYGFRLCGLAENLLAKGQIDEAHSLFQQSVSRMHTGELWGFGRGLAGLSMTTFLTGDSEAAWKVVRQALEIHLEMRTFYFAHFSLSAYAYLLSQHDEALFGVEIYNLVAQQKFVNQSLWFADLYQKPIHASVRKLPKGDISKAEAKGKNLDFWHTVGKIIEGG
jgi:tetratricopeptide (TPR) repeat protein